MNKFKGFLKDNIWYSAIYFLAMICVIGFYCLTTKDAEVLYPIFVAVFFYIVYMSVQYIVYSKHLRNIDVLSENKMNIKSSRYEYKKTYDTFNHLHQVYNNQIADMSDKNTMDRRFISGYIHNLKTPVTVSSIIVQRVKAGEIEAANAVDAIDVELMRMNQGLNMLLDIKRLEELEKDYEPSGVDLAEDIRSVINANKTLFINSYVYPKFEGEGSMVFTDSKWNQVLIGQIVSNAVKYSKSSDGENRHIYFEIIKRGKYTELTIRDEGVGIPEYDLQRVFEAFFTGDNGRKGYNSSGIGLYLCKTICNRLGQKIKIENDNGCKVTITYLSKL
ncbi:MAG: sensor histidine kinase [Eubacteriales bacterium]|nr:sensor histidine kinase [Eubacteriales bacterium]